MERSTVERWRRRAPLWVCLELVVLLAIGGSGCSSTPSGSSGAAVVRPVERLDLLLTPVALDMDGRPGADGFGVRIYATNRRSAFGNPIVEGTLEFLMYDGTVRTDELAGVTPLRTWRYPASELKSYLQKTSIGVGYAFGLNWGESKPAGDRITVVARYEAADKFVVMSAPGAISLTVK